MLNLVFDYEITKPKKTHKTQGIPIKTKLERKLDRIRIASLVRLAPPESFYSASRPEP